MTSVGIMSAAVLVGLGGASAAYELASGDRPTPSSQSVSGVAPSANAQLAKVRWAPCDPPAKLRGRVCVTDVVRTVVLPGAAVPVGIAGLAAPGHDAFDDHGGDRDRDGRDEAGDDRDDSDRFDGDDDHDAFDDRDAFDDHGGDRDRDDRAEAGDDRDEDDRADDHDDDDRDDLDDRDDDDHDDDRDDH